MLDGVETDLKRVILTGWRNLVVTQPYDIFILYIA